jgi:hypothetical protein
MIDMRRWYKQPSTYVLILGILLGLAGFAEPVYHLLHGDDISIDEVFWLGAALLIFMTSISLASILQQFEVAADVDDVSERLAKKIGDELSVIAGQIKSAELSISAAIAGIGPMLAYANERSFVEIVGQASKLFEESSPATFGVHKRRYTIRRIRSLLAATSQEINRPIHVEYSKEEDDDRQAELVEAIREARSYIRAVTYDEGNYISDFWADSRSTRGAETATSYATANSERAGLIERFYLLSDETIQDTDSPKRQIVNKLVSEQLRAGSSVAVLPITHLPPSWRDYGRSFLVSDDCYASESYRDAPVGNGGIWINDAKKVQECNKFFFMLKAFTPIDIARFTLGGRL